MIKIILDTDMGPDCDDAGALAIANKLHNNHDIQLLGVTHCTSDIGGAYTAAAINSQYSNDLIPVGQTGIKGFLDGEENKKFTDEIMENYISRYGRRVFEESVSVLRSLLAENNGVKLVCIGPLNTLSALLKSEPDDKISLTGRELAEKSLDCVVVMGGDFRGNESGAEYNIRCDIASARYAAENCPVPIVYCGFETGMDVLTGRTLKEAEKTNPVRIAYERFLKKSGHGESFLRPSWDLTAVCYAAKGEMEMWELSEAVTVSFDENGVTKIAPGGKDRYLINKAKADVIAAKIEEFLAD